MFHQLHRVLFICCALAPGFLLAQTQPATQPATTQQAERLTARRPQPTTQDRGEEPVVTEHELKLGEQTLDYKATAGFIPLKDRAGKVRAKVFYIAYTKRPDDPAEQAARPVTFVFNGGPGAASVWLHLGTAGPQRIDLASDGSIPAPPYKLVENKYTWLDFTDLVFIDPVGTGYSRAEGDHASEFYNVDGDIASVADVIRLYLTIEDRWSSPKFVAGESYGTTRAAGLSEYLHSRYGIDANGIVLISTVLNFQTLEFAPGNDTPYPLWLPSYTAIAWYHHKLSPDLQQGGLPKAVAEAQRFALDEYMPALLKGSSLDDSSRQRIAKQLSGFTGLSVDYLIKGHLKVSPGRFEKALMNDQEKIVGRMDGRILGHDPDPLNDTPNYDPSMTGYFGIFSSTFNAYVQSQLKFESDLPYEFLTSNVGPWDFGKEGYLDVSTRLRSAMTEVPSMKVMIASGYFDLATPFTATDYTVNQMPLGPTLRKNIVQHYYDAGHMVYLNHPSLVKLHDDLKNFYEGALPAAATTAPSR